MTDEKPEGVLYNGHVPPAHQPIHIAGEVGGVGPKVADVIGLHQGNPAIPHVAFVTVQGEFMGIAIGLGMAVKMTQMYATSAWPRYRKAEHPSGIVLYTPVAGLETDDGKGETEDGEDEQAGS